MPLAASFGESGRAAGRALLIRSPPVMMTPHLVQFLMNGALNFVTHVHVGRELNRDGPVPRLGANVARCHGEAVGFWDQDTLVTWTSNIQARATHAPLVDFLNGPLRN